jgi:uncharacterized membrane protein HdeD (DUF308 family)
MVMHIVNYLVRILIILIGVVLLIYPPRNQDSSFMAIMGIVLILWGIFRIITYRMKAKQIKREQDEN